MTKSERAWTCRARLSVSGVGVSIASDFRAWTSSREVGVQPAFPPSVVVAMKALACELP